MRPFAASAGVVRLGALAVAGLILLPAAIAAILTWALSAPTQHLDRITAAIVNDDVPVTLDGQTVPVGRQLAAGLLASDGIDWVLTNDDEAAAGLAAGRYVAVVTIPASFSARATSSAGPPQDAQQAALRVETTPSSALLDPSLIESVTDAAVSALNSQLIAQYLTQLYQGFTTIDQQIGQAASGADDLAAGASSLADGAQQLVAGADQLTSGLQSLDAGAGALSDGLAQLDAGAQDLPGETAQLARGSTAVASAVDPLAAQVAAATAELAATVDAVCQTPGRECDLASRALTRLQGIDEGVGTLATVADGVAAGNRSLAAGMPELVDGIGQSAAGAADLVAGADQATGGAEALDAGSESVASGAAQVDSGAAQLAEGLAQAVEQIPSYTDADITVLSSVASQPVRADLVAPAPGTQAVPFFAVVALWIGAVVVAYARTAVPRGALLTSTPSGSIARRAALPGAGIGVAQGVVTSGAVLVAVHVDAGAWLGFVAAGGLVGLVFVVVNQGLAAAFGGAGRFAAVLVAVIALAVGISSTVPPALGSLAALLPTAPGFGLLLAALIGETAAIRASVLGLVGFGLVGAVLVLLGVVARRRVRVADLAGSGV